MVIVAAAISSTVSNINISGIVAADDGSSCRRTNLSGVRIYPTFSRRRFSSIRGVSLIRGDAQFHIPSLSRSFFCYPQKLGFSGRSLSALEALPNVCENVIPSSIKSFNQQGNRSSSSACGSVDVLEALGVVIDLGPEGIKRCVEESGISFMMSPMYHPAMKIVGPVRKKLKIKTVFNILGPMLNPDSWFFCLCLHQS